MGQLRAALIFFDASPKKLLEKQSSCWGFEAPWCSYDVTVKRLYRVGYLMALPRQIWSPLTNIKARRKYNLLDHVESLLLTRLNFNPSMDKESHAW